MKCKKIVVHAIFTMLDGKIFIEALILFHLKNAFTPSPARLPCYGNLAQFNSFRAKNIPALDGNADVPFYAYKVGQA